MIITIHIDLLWFVLESSLITLNAEPVNPLINGIATDAENVELSKETSRSFSLIRTLTSHWVDQRKRFSATCIE